MRIRHSKNATKQIVREYKQNDCSIWAVLWHESTILFVDKNKHWQWTKIQSHIFKIPNMKQNRYIFMFCVYSNENTWNVNKCSRSFKFERAIKRYQKWTFGILFKKEKNTVKFHWNSFECFLSYQINIRTSNWKCHFFRLPSDIPNILSELRL